MKLAIIVIVCFAYANASIREHICNACHKYVGNVDEMLANPQNQDKARKTLERVCNIFSLFGDTERHDACVAKVDSAVTSAMGSAANGLEPHKFCFKIHACESQMKREPWIDWSKWQQKACDECHVVAGKVDAILENPQNQQRARGLLEKVCGVFSLIGDSDRYKSCITQIDNTVNRIMSGAADKMEPNRFCQAIHICKAPAKRDLAGIRQKICSVCHDKVGAVDHMLADPNNQVKARETLDRICSIFSLFGDDARYQQCKNSVDNAVTKAMSGAAGALEPNKFCKSIHACENFKRGIFDFDFGSIRAKACDQCHVMAGKVDAMLADPNNQQRARGILEKICSVFTLFGDDARYQSCIKTIDNAVNKAMSGAASGLEPIKFCQNIHVCAAPAKRSFSIDFGAIRDKACNQCHKALAGLDAMLENPNNEKKVRSILEKFCSFHSLFGDEAGYNTCIQKVDAKIHAVMTDLAENKLESNKFCKDIHICRA